MSFIRKDYTARDYDSIVAQTQQYLSDNYPSLLLDFSAMSPEQLFLDMFAFMSDVNHLYIDAAFSEFFVDTFAERQSGISLGGWSDYQVSMKSAASISLKYTYTTLDGGAPPSLILPIGTTLTDKHGQIWTVMTPQTLSEAGAIVGDTFELYQGSLVTDNWAASGEPNQEIISSRRSIASNIEPVVEFDSSSATKVSNLLNVTIGDYYERDFLGDTTFRLRVGDGINGSMPANTISAAYIITSGPDGNISQNILTGKFKPQVDVEIYYYHLTPASGGADPESIDHIRKGIPAHASAVNTVVTKQDYITMINEESGIQFASAEFDPVIRRNICYIMSSSYGDVSNLGLLSLRNTLMEKYQLNSSVIFKNINYAGIVVHVQVFLEGDRNIQKNMKFDEIQLKIESFFEPGESDPIYCGTGEPVRISDFYGMLEAIEGVDYVEIAVFTRKPALIEDTWSEAVDALALKSWSLRPTYQLNNDQYLGTGTVQISSIDSDPVGEVTEQGLVRIYGTGAYAATISAQVAGVGGRLLTGDWTQQLSQVPLERVKIQMSNSYGNYRWSSWSLSDGTIPPPMRLTGDDALFRSKTSHFLISHFSDRLEYKDSGIGYVGKTYQLDSGGLTFRIDSPNGITDDTENIAEQVYISSEEFDLDYYVGYTLQKNIRVSTLTGTYVTYVTLIDDVVELMIPFKDDGFGGIINSTTSAIIGYIDYDRGYLAFLGTCGVGNVIINYRSMNFANEAGEIANIILSPYDNTIVMAKNEYPVLDVLKLEVDYN